MEHKKTLEYITNEVESHVLSTLMDYIRVDNLSINFDPEWATNGKHEKAADILLKWALSQNVKGLKGEVLKIEGLSPLIHLEIESNGRDDNLLMYGHFDKQPHMLGWKEGTGPCDPVIIGDLLYGRGGADDGYAIFASVLSIKALQHFGLKHGKVNIIIEGSEESGSVHLFQYVDLLKDKIGTPDLLVCMDSGCKDYDRLWITSTLRGLILKDLTVKCLDEGVHSGLGGGQGPDSFTVIRSLLDRIEDSKTGVVVDDFQVKIPESKYAEANNVAKILGNGFALVKLSEGVTYTTNDLPELYLRGTWKANLTVVGQTGLPLHSTSGNVLRGQTSVRLSMRLPPTKDPNEASEKLSELLLKDPPYNSIISLEDKSKGQGLYLGELPEKLKTSLNNSSIAIWGQESQEFGEGGSIPFLNSFAQKFPKSQLLVLGLLGPGSNAHAPNETLHIPYLKKIITTLSHAVYEFK